MPRGRRALPVRCQGDPCRAAPRHPQTRPSGRGRVTCRRGRRTVPAILAGIAAIWHGRLRRLWVAPRGRRAGDGGRILRRRDALPVHRGALGRAPGRRRAARPGGPGDRAIRRRLRGRSVQLRRAALHVRAGASSASGAPTAAARGSSARSVRWPSTARATCTCSTAPTTASRCSPPAGTSCARGAAAARRLGRFRFGGGGRAEIPPGGGLAVSGSHVYVADSGGDRIQRFTLQGTDATAFGGPGSGPGRFADPRGLTIAGGRLYVADDQNHRVQVLTLDGAYIAQTPPAATGVAHLADPYDVAVDAGGEVFVADDNNNRIVRFTPSLHYAGAWRTPGRQRRDDRLHPRGGRRRPRRRLRRRQRSRPRRRVRSQRHATAAVGRLGPVARPVRRPPGRHPATAAAASWSSRATAAAPACSGSTAPSRCARAGPAAAT